MYGLKQAALLAYQQLKERLAKHGYYPIQKTNGLWKQGTWKTMFALCVDDFGVKFFKKDDAQHLIDALKEHYDVSIDWDGMSYCGLTFEWLYKKRYVDVFMPNYVKTALQKYQHSKQNKPQYAPHRWNQPIYGHQVQYTVEPDDSEKLDAKGKRFVQSIVGTFLYYAQSVEPTTLLALTKS